jgi:Domain of unknown function (DUF1996)
MKHLAIRKPALLLSLTTAIVAAASGCAAPDGGALGQQAQGLTDPAWTRCARAGEFCAFSGTRRVRYGRDDRYTTGTFTDGVRCARSSFPSANLYRRRNHCDVDMSTPVEHDDTLPDDMPSAGTGVPTAGAPAPTPTTDAGIHDMHTDDPMPMGDMSLAPFVDITRIPTGDPGSSSVFINTTTAQPRTSDGTGAFRTVCLFSHMNFDDPLVFPGKPGASHLHAFFGNTLTHAYSTASTIKNSGNSTCRGGIANRTAYWVPAIVDAKGVPQAPDLMNVYYKTGYKLPPSTIRPFPEGLRMLAGDPKANFKQWFAQWACMAGGGHVDTVPTSCPPGSSIVMALTFPQCWDGVNLDSPDHRSHMAYPTGLTCPSTHPVPIPEITYNVNYPVPAAGAASWRLVSDMYDPSLPGGYSVHGDWIEGWDPEVSTTFVQRCDAAALDCASHLLGDGRAIYNPHETY